MIATCRIATTLVLFAFAMAAPAQEPYPAARLGLVQSANNLLGTPVRNREGQKIGSIKDFIADPKPGRIHCALVMPANFYGNPDYLIAVPSQAFLSADAEGAVVDISNTNLFEFPRFAVTPWDVATVSNSLEQAAGQFGRKISLDPQARFVRCSSLLGSGINNQSGVNIGKLSDLALDLPAGRLLFAVASFYGLNENLHAIPPAAFTISSNPKALTLNVDDTRTAAFVRPDGYLWTRLADPAFVAASYRAFGKQLAFDNSPAFDAVAARNVLRTDPPPPVEPFVPKDDADITRYILGAFMRADFDADSTLNDVKISTSGGKVTLTGRVASETQKNRLNTIAERAAGPGNVINQITVQ